MAIRSIVIEARGGHMELERILLAVNHEIGRLRREAEGDPMFFSRSSTRPPAFITNPINLEGTITIKTEESL